MLPSASPVKLSPALTSAVETRFPPVVRLTISPAEAPVRLIPVPAAIRMSLPATAAPLTVIDPPVLTGEAEVIAPGLKKAIEPPSPDMLALAM